MVGASLFINPIAFQGGVAANLGMRRAFCDILKLKPEELIIPKHYLTMGAIGAALDAKERQINNYHFSGLEKLKQAIVEEKEVKHFYPPLRLLKSRFERSTLFEHKHKKIPVYLGIDVGFSEHKFGVDK
ncbi:hypothetical protein DMNBHIDG_03090 [Candidatus Methanoperedenaceae archaeon GB37]|nr:hypothetical protein DMNBHIDG_03090 [Candidatus Methanoperedenaceae archaeon GB37]